MPNPAWIVVDDGNTFEGHQGHWGDCYFSNATMSDIIHSLTNDEMFAHSKVFIRRMTDVELKKYPEALEFEQYLLDTYGEI